MAIIALPRINHLQIVRRDLDRENISKLVVKLYTQWHPVVSSMDIAKAMHKAFPELRPDELIYSPPAQRIIRPS
jgi:hypothetical protein